MANTLKVFQNGAVGFIDWLGVRQGIMRRRGSRDLSLTRALATSNERAAGSDDEDRTTEF